MVASTLLLAVLVLSGEAPPILDSPILFSRLQIPCILFFAFLALDTVLGSGRFGRFSRRIDQGSSEPRDRFWVGAIVTILVLLGWTLRWADLDKYGVSPDEAIFIYTSSGETVWDVLSNSLLNAHPPANFLVLHLLLKVSWDPVWIRLASLIGGTYLIWITYMFGRQWVGTTGGLLMAALVTFSPTLILLSRVARNYSPGMALLVTALYFAVRFIQEERWRYFYWFAAFEFLATTWHYSFLIVIIGVNLTLAAVLIHRRRGWRWWVKVVLAQLPLALGFAFAFFVHLPRMATFHLNDYMLKEYHFSIPLFWAPIYFLSRYLLAGGPGAIFFVLMVIALGTLWLNGRYWPIVFCLASIPFSYAFAMMGLLPFGGTRHSSFLYPFLFGLIGSQAPEFLDGFKRTRVGLKRLWGRARGVSSMDRASLPERRSDSRWGLLALFALCFFYVNSALSMYAYNTPYEERHLSDHTERFPFYDTNFYKLIEAPTRTEDLDRVWTTVKDNAGPNDIVLLSYSSLIILKWRLAPGDTMLFDTASPMHFEKEGVNFYYAPEAQWGYDSVESMMKSIAGVGERYQIDEIDKVWIPSVGWEIWIEKPFKGMVETAYNELLVGDSAYEDSRGLVFPVDGELARRLGTAVHAQQRVLLMDQTPDFVPDPDASRGPNDIVVVSWRFLVVLEMFLVDRIKFDPTLPNRITLDGLTYYYSPELQSTSTPETIVKAIADVVANYNLDEVGRVWIARDSRERPWEEESLASSLRRIYPGLVIEHPVIEESLELVIPIERSEAVRIGRELFEADGGAEARR